MLFIWVFCTFQVNGGWTDWSSWEICSVECGGGTQSSGRTCTNPQPVGTGVACSGLSTQSRSCNTDPCPGMNNFLWTFYVLVNSIPL